MICPHCKSDMIWNSDSDLDDDLGSGYKMVSFHECPACLTWIEVYHPDSMFVIEIPKKDYKT